MNISEANMKVADLLDEESASEFASKLPAFYDYAQKQIATTVDPIEFDTVLELTNSDETEIDLSDWLYTKEEKKLYKIRKIITDGEYEHIYGNVFKFNAGTKYRLFLYIYPETINNDTDLTHEFEISPEGQSAILYYAAAQVVLTDTDTRPYYALMDRYNNILQNISDSRRENVRLSVVKLGGVSSGV